MALGAELWRTDGTALGTVLVEAILPDPENTITFQFLTAFGDRVFFSANTPAGEVEPWISDGTPEGTHVLKDLDPRNHSSDPQEFVPGNTILYFEAHTGPGPTIDVKTWRTDGTTEGTFPIFDGFIRGSVAIGDTLFFTPENHGLWRTDGTPETTSLIINDDPRNMAVVGNLVFFTVRHSSSGDFPSKIWRTDGTPGGTFPIFDVHKATPDIAFTDVNGVAYFSMDNGVTGSELWKSNGTTAGTVPVKDIVPGSNGSRPQLMTNVNGTVFFRATDTFFETELWKSDGTEAGTVRVKDIGEFVSSLPSNLFNAQGRLLFVATGPGTGRELWTSDGTEQGTFLVRDLNPGSGQGTLSPFRITQLGSVVLFTGSDGTNPGLYRTDGSEEGTTPFFHTGGTTVIFGLNDHTIVDGQQFFSFTSTSEGTELWRTDGSSDGTKITADYPGPSGRSTTQFASINNQLILDGREGSLGRELQILRPFANTPSITTAVTTTAQWTTSGLVVTRNSADGNEVTHVKITNITHGSLFLNDGVTPVVDGDFVSFDEAELGFKFTPAAGFSGTATFGVQASTSDNDEGLGGDGVTAKVFVVPTFTNANDTLYLIANTNQTEVEVYDVDPFQFAVPPLISWPVDLPDQLPLNTLGGDDQIFVQLPAGMSGPADGIRFDTGAGTNLLTVRGGNVLIDSTSTGGSLITIVTAGAQLTTSRLDQRRLALQGTDTRVTLLSGGGVSVLDDLELSLGTTLDVTNNTLVLHGSEANKDGRYADLRARS